MFTRSRRFERDVAMLIRWIDDNCVITERPGVDDCCLGGEGEYDCASYCSPNGCSGHHYVCRNPRCDLADTMKLYHRIARQIRMSYPNYQWRPWRTVPRYLAFRTPDLWKFNPGYKEPK